MSGDRDGDGARLPWKRLRPYLPVALLATAGAGLAAAYAHFIGCRTGTCPITSRAWTAALYGGSVGALVAWPGRKGARPSTDEPGGAHPPP
jgi:hypothetical protein